MKLLRRVGVFVTYHAAPSMGFSSQEYWRGLPFPSPGDLPDPGIEPSSPALQVDALLSGASDFASLWATSGLQYAVGFRGEQRAFQIFPAVLPCALCALVGTVCRPSGGCKLAARVPG